MLLLHINATDQKDDENEADEEDESASDHQRHVVHHPAIEVCKTHVTRPSHPHATSRPTRWEMIGYDAPYNLHTIINMIM